MKLLPDLVKKGLLGLNRLSGTMERWNLVSYQDRVRLRHPRYCRTVLSDQQGQDRIAQLIATGLPLMVSRLGSVELSSLRFFLERRRVRQQPYDRKLRYAMENNAGFFPAEDRQLDNFAELYLENLALVDLLGVWFNYYEDAICNNYCAGAEFADLASLEPFRYRTPWSRLLKGKKVLVVHPFIDSITCQYREKRRLLFANPDTLPEFELKTVRAVQSIAACPVPFATWFEAFRHTCSEMEKVDFDVCLIGAGAYGLPLAAFAKKLGKQAIHMGGVTQILFGIKGRRWERDDYKDSTATMFNEHWIRPLESEAPANKDKVENGCYW